MHKQIDTLGFAGLMSGLIVAITEAKLFSFPDGNFLKYSYIPILFAITIYIGLLIFKYKVRFSRFIEWVILCWLGFFAATASTVAAGAAFRAHSINFLILIPGFIGGLLMVIGFSRLVSNVTKYKIAIISFISGLVEFFFMAKLAHMSDADISLRFTTFIGYLVLTWQTIMGFCLGIFLESKSNRLQEGKLLFERRVEEITRTNV